MIPLPSRRENNAIDEAGDDEIGRFVPNAAGPGHHELAQLVGKIDGGWIDREIAPLYSDNGAAWHPTRFAVGLRHVIDQTQKYRAPDRSAYVGCSDHDTKNPRHIHDRAP
jgi:hypothetical protein